MISENITEQQLVQRLFTKDRAAWKEFYNSYSAGLTYVCMRYIKEPEDVRDVLQNSFVKMFHAIDTFQYKGKGALKAWSTRIVINESLQQLKSISKFEKVNTPENLPNEEEEENPDLMDIPESDILEMIRSLPDGYRTVFNLYVFEQKSHKEIAKLLAIAENSSASQFHRAKKILMQKINSYRQLKKDIL